MPSALSLASRCSAMALNWRCDRPEAMTMKSAMLDLPWRSMTTMSSALSSSSDVSMRLRSRWEDSRDEVPWACRLRGMLLTLLLLHDARLLAARLWVEHPWACCVPARSPTGVDGVRHEWPSPIAD